MEFQTLLEFPWFCMITLKNCPSFFLRDDISGNFEVEDKISVLKQDWKCPRSTLPKLQKSKVRIANWPQRLKRATRYFFFTKTWLKVNFSADREHNTRPRGPRNRKVCENGEIHEKVGKSQTTTTYRLLGPQSAIACSRSKSNQTPC